MPISEQIAKFIIQFMKKNQISAYNEKTRKGTIRHIVVKIGRNTNQVMCIIVTNERKIPKQDLLVQKLKENFLEIKTIVKNINLKNTNVILGNENEILYGNGYIQDKLGNFTFNISPFSFYQINPIQTEKLYNLAITKAKLKKEDIVLDLYCGIGTIGIFVSKYVKNVPPRKGLDKQTIQNILKLKPERLVYISCNPATLVRDLKEFEDKYEIEEIQTVDMFPFTSHVECCSVLYLKDTIQ